MSNPKIPDHFHFTEMVTITKPRGFFTFQAPKGHKVLAGYLGFSNRSFLFGFRKDLRKLCFLSISWHSLMTLIVKISDPCYVKYSFGRHW